jgi:hypothetical protein
MSFLTKILFAWLLMLTVPLQGYAASTMWFCGPGQHTSTSRMSPSAGEMNTKGSVKHGHIAAHHDHASTVHEQVKFQSDLSTDASPQDHASTQTAGKHLTGKCSMCASCCGSAAIVSTFTLPPLEPVSSAVEALSLPTIIGIPVHGLERPPRA